MQAKIRDFIFCIIVVFSIVPNIFTIHIFFAITLMWLYFALNSNTKVFYSIFTKPRAFNYSLYLWLFVGLLFLLFGNQDQMSLQMPLNVRIVIQLLMGAYYIELNNINIIKKITKWAIFTIIVVCVITIYFLFENPMLARLMATGSHKFTGLQNIVGGYGFIYGLIFIFLIILSCLMENIITRKRFFWILLLSLLIFTIYKSNYMIAVIFVFMFGVISLLRVNKISHFILLAIIISSTFFSLSDAAADILYNLSAQSSTYTMTKRYRELGDFLKKGQFSENADGAKRLNLYNISWDTFQSNPILGIGGIYGQSSHLVGIGGHSSFLDELARYGLFGFMPFIIGIISFVKFSCKNMDNKKRIVYIKCVFPFFILGFVNTVLFPPVIYSVFSTANFIILSFMENNTKTEIAEQNTAI